MRRTLLVMAATVVLLVGAGLVIHFRGTPPVTTLPIPIGGPCEVSTDSGQVVLEADQMANAATIAAVGLSRGLPDRAVLVALATAMQESELLNLPYGDRDSVGLFQQRPSMGWGTAEQIQDQRYAAHAFYNSLVRVSGWEEMRVTDAAQLVQRSAFPEAYERWAGDASVLTEALAGQTGASLRCVHGDDPSLSGADAAAALGAGLRLDWDGGIEASTIRVGHGDISVAVADDRTGWQYAHWFVAQSTERAVRSVRFRDLTWNAETGEWSHVDANRDDAARVVAQVYQP